VCLLRAEFAARFKYNRSTDRLELDGWRLECLNENHNFHTKVYKTKDEAVKEWNKMTEGNRLLNENQ
jgi:hypothetical protein